MINSITGTITAKEPLALYLQTGGIEWEILMPSTDIGAQEEPGVETKIWTWLCHREDSMTIYGFSSEQRRKTFIELLKVEGIGPKAAIKILSGITQSDLEKALESGDVTRLEAVPGLGKKTAQKMILTLKGKIVHAPEKGGKQTTAYPDLADALTAMGYEKRAACAALEQAAQETPDGADRENVIFRKAILMLSGR